MEDRPEDKAPKAKARPRAARRTKVADAKLPRKAPAQGEKPAKPSAAGRSQAVTAGVEARPAAKKVRAPAKAKQPKQPPISSPAERPPESEAPAQTTAPPPKPRSPAPAELLHTEGPADDVTIHPVAPHVPNTHPHDEGLEFGLSPVDLAPDASVREEAGLGWFIRILAFSSVLLVLFNSFAIDKWAREQPVTKLNSQVLVAAHRLHAEMQSLHLNAPLEGMRSVWHGIRDARWPGSPGDREKSGSENAPGK